MNYNTSREKLVIREYGRNIQSLIRYAITVEDRNKRNKLAEHIIEMMSQLNPQMRSIDEYKRKLWDHLFLISDFKLDVDAPYPMPSPEEMEHTQVMRMEYPRDEIRFKHYGKNVETMVEKALEMEDKEKQQDFAEVIANYMKMVYNIWNSDNINDEIIKNDLDTLSKGKLSLKDSSNLDTLRHSNRKKRTNTKSNYRDNNKRDNKRGGGRRRTNKN